MPLSLRESQEYIDHRLHIAGSKISNIFTDEAVSLICNYAKGIPRTINALCDNALLIGYSLSKKRIDGDIIHEVIRDMEGSVRDNLAPVEPVAANLFKPSPFKSSTYYKMSSFFIIFLLCILLGVVLGREYFQENSNRTEDNKSKQNTSADVSQITSKGEVKIKRSVTVGKNDSLSSLGWKYYGTLNETLVDLILDSNPQIKNIHLINVGQQIILPEITEESLIILSMDHTFEIHLGTFVDTQSARKYENEPALMGKEIEIIPREVSPVDTWYRITAGKYDDKGACLEVIGLLRKKKLLPVFEGV